MHGTETTTGLDRPHHPATAAARHASDAPTSGITVPSFGWTGVAMALHRLQQQPSPSIVTVRVPGHLPLTIDVEANAYWWDTPLADFPTDPREVEVVTTAKDPAQEASRAPGSDLDALLWLVGNHSFLGELAWWLQRHDRYRLVRWPNLTTLPHTPDQMRMTAMLGYTFLPVEELANASDTDPAEARRLVNAFSLMRLLRSETPDVADTATAQEPPIATATTAPPRGGLFRRLRDRLGL
ncbi:hypothetical protein [Frigoribacterium salinisoli]